MKRTVEHIINELNLFVPKDDYADLDLREILEGVYEVENPALVIPAMFKLMQKYPDVDFGSPGVLVHSIERIGDYDDELVASIKAVPTYLNVWMVNRILNSDLSAEKRSFWLSLLELVLENPSANKLAKESAKDFIEYQSKRDYQN